MKLSLRSVNIEGWLIKGSVDVVKWNRIIWVRGIARNVGDDSKVSLVSSSFDAGLVDEMGDLVREVYAVDEDID